MHLRRRVALSLPLLLATLPLRAQVTSRAVQVGRVSGEFFVPAKVPAPAIFVLHTAFGRAGPSDIAMAKTLATAGFVAFAINYPLSPNRDWVPLYLEWMKAQPEAAGQPLGAVGFSAGGGRVFDFAAADPRVKAVVCYYGTYDNKVSPIANLRNGPNTGPIGFVDRIGAAALLMHGSRDTEVPPESIERMKLALQAKGLPAEVVIYPGAYHNFDRGSEAGNGDRTNNGTLVAYDGAAAKDAQARTIAWFKTYLK